MLVYTVKRLGLAVLIVLSALTMLFIGIQFVPGDPISLALGPRASPETVAYYVQKMGLDDPAHVRLGLFLGHMLQGDLGQDVLTDRPVLDMILEELPYTLSLAVVSLGWAVLVAVPLGCLSAIRPNTILDRITGFIAIGTITIPTFLVGIWGLLLFAVTLKWLPVIGAGDPGDPVDQMVHIILPALAIGSSWVGYIARVVRATMLEVMNENYIRAARAFGLRENVIVYRYALKVAILPVITLLGMGFGHLLSGALLAEIIFTRPGIGTLAYEAISNRNFPVVQGALVITTLFYVLATLCTDLIVAWLDPRVREAL